MCPAGTLVIGGGFYDDSEGGLRIDASHRDATAQNWKVWATNLTGSTKEILVYAVCLSGQGGSVRQRSMSTLIPANTSGSVTATCESNEIVTGGGFSAEDEVVVYSSTGPWSGADGNDEWRVYGFNTNASTPQTLFGYAMCADLAIFADGFESGDTSEWSAVVP